MRAVDWIAITICAVSGPTLSENPWRRRGQWLGLVAALAAVWLLGCQPTRIIVTPATPQVTIEHRTCALPDPPRLPVLSAPVTADSIAEVMRWDRAVGKWMETAGECLK